MTSDVEDIEVALLLEGIHERYGVDLRGYTRPAMKRRILALLARSGFPHLGALQHALLTDAALFRSAADDLLVNVTEMFRDPAFFVAFRELVVPVLRTFPSLKIWCSGCASGEEVYSVAIVLAEEGLLERTQLYATDASARAVEQAKQGVYAKQSLDAFHAAYASAGGRGDPSAYYTAAYGGFAVRDSLRKNAVFFQHDLVSDHVFGEMNVILCRNVLIYFGEELRERVFDKLEGSLRPGGFLCLGSSERPAERRPLVELRERIYRYDP